MDLLTVAILAWFGWGGIIGVACALVIMLGILLFISSILWLLGMSVYSIVAFWALYFGIPLFWKYVHDKEEKEQKEKREQSNGQSNFEKETDATCMAKSVTQSKKGVPIDERKSEKESEEGELLFSVEIEVRKQH